MFIIREVLVEDKKLPTVLRALAGNVVSMTTPQPIAEVTNGASDPQTMLDVVRSMSGTFTSADLSKALRHAGFSEKGASSTLNRAKEEGIVVKKGYNQWRIK